MKRNYTKLEMELNGRLFRTWTLMFFDGCEWQRDLAIRELIISIQKQYYFLFETCQIYFYLILESKMNHAKVEERKLLKAA